MTDKKPSDEAAFESSAFEALERDFQEVLTELVGDQSLERFRQEYEKLHRALRKSHESEKRLIKKCKELNGEIVANAAKVQTALKLSQDDQGTITQLKKEIEKAWKMVEASHEKEARAKETIQQLKLEISNLSRLVEQGAGLGVSEDQTVLELTKQKDELTRERDAQVAQIVDLRNQLVELQEKIRSLEISKIESDQEVLTLREAIAKKKSESDREQRRKERLEKELKELKERIETMAADMKAKQVAVAQGNDTIARLEQQLREQKAANEGAQKEFEALSSYKDKLEAEREEQEHMNNNLGLLNNQQKIELRVKDDEINQTKQEIMRVNKVREGLLKKVKQLEDEKVKVETERDGVKSEMKNLEREIEDQKKQADADKKTIDDLVKERDMLSKQLKKTETATSKIQDIIKVNMNTKRNLEQEITGYKREAERQRKLIYQLEKEREKYAIEASDAAAKYQAALEEVKLREMNILDLQTQITEGEHRLKQQQNLYEGVRSDRNLYSKNLIESMDEIAEMKRKFKIMNHQIEQLKEEITAKEGALVKEHFEHIKVEKETEQLTNENLKIRHQILEAQQTMNSQKVEISKLNHIINEADQERVRQKKAYEDVINARDILGTQLIRRNDELALLYEKIKIQQSTLAKGEVQYRQRLEDIALLKVKINDERRQLYILKRQVKNIDELKAEKIALERELLEERTKVKALSEELENPMNVHRWRKLEGSDPPTYEMIQKIHTLQKRLIAKTEEVVEKDMLIQEKEKLYVELKNILARQPGPEVAEQLSIYQQNLRDKTRQMKAMASELNMYQAQVNEYKYEIERLSRELTEVKKRYFDHKRREQLDRERSRRTGGDDIDNELTTEPAAARYAGGGYNLDPTT